MQSCSYWVINYANQPADPEKIHQIRAIIECFVSLKFYPQPIATNKIQRVDFFWYPFVSANHQVVLKLAQAPLAF